jgi:hypothetical protein
MINSLILLLESQESLGFKGWGCPNTDQEQLASTKKFLNLAVLGVFPSSRFIYSSTLGGTVGRFISA